MAKNPRQIEQPPPNREKKPHRERPLDVSEAEHPIPTQTFQRFAKNRSTKRPRKWLITYQLLEGPAIQPTQNRPSGSATPAPEPEPPSRSAQGELFEPAPARQKKAGQRKGK